MAKGVAEVQQCTSTLGGKFVLIGAHDASLKLAAAPDHARKIGVRGRAEASAYAERHGLTERK